MTFKHYDINKIKDYVRGYTSDKRYHHTEAVAEVCEGLSLRYGVDVEKAVVAAYLHDVAKELDAQEHKAIFETCNLSPADFYNINVTHGKIGAIMATHFLSIHDEDILNAIAYHTTGRAGMSLLEKTIFIGDVISTDRVYKDIDWVRDRAFENLDEACMLKLEYIQEDLKSKNIPVAQDTLDAYAYLKKMMKINHILTEL